MCSFSRQNSSHPRFLALANRFAADDTALSQRVYSIIETHTPFLVTFSSKRSDRSPPSGRQSSTTVVILHARSFSFRRAVQTSAPNANTSFFNKMRGFYPNDSSGM